MKTDDIQPLSVHRAHLTEHFQRAEKTGRPLFITNNGRTAAVVLSPKAYDELAAQADLAANLAAIDRGMKDIEAGRVMTSSQARKHIAKSTGVKLRR